MIGFIIRCLLIFTKSALPLQLHITILHPPKALHNEVKEKTKDSRSNEIKTDDFNKKQVVVGS